MDRKDLAPVYSLGRRYWHRTVGDLSTRVLLLPPTVCPILSDVGKRLSKAWEYRDEK
jgi:hypothetical protein